MKNKIVKTVPLLMVSLLSLAGCDNNDTDTLVGFVRSLKEGELTQEEIAPLFENGMLESNVKNVKYAEYEIAEYSPRWAFVDGLDENEYEQLVHNINEKYTFRSYDNDVIVTTEDVARYEYDKDEIGDLEDSPECISKTPTSYKGQSVIWANKPTEEDAEGSITYVYTRDNDINNAYSFVDKIAYDEDMMSKLLQGGDGGSQKIYSMSDSVASVKEYFEGYSTQSGIYEVKEDYSSIKKVDEETKANELTVVFSGFLFFTPYSCESNWAYETVDGKEVKTTNAYDGIYCKMGLAFGYYLDIVDGFIKSAQFIHTAYTAYLLKDANWKSGDPTPSKGNLSEEELSKLDLVQTDTLADGSQNNIQGGILSAYPYTIESLKTDGEKLGKYRKTLPDTTKYRESDMTDNGCWFDILVDLRD